MNSVADDTITVTLTLPMGAIAARQTDIEIAREVYAVARRMVETTPGASVTLAQGPRVILHFSA